VAIVGTDVPFRRALTELLSQRDRDVVSGPDHACLASLEGWAADWRELDVEAVVIDFGANVAGGLEALDAVRRRDPYAFVIVLSRVFGALGGARVGANLILEGDVAPEVVFDALVRTRATCLRDRDRR
jgi:DNA-binding NarL/FixJ family response regulator